MFRVLLLFTLAFLFISCGKKQGKKVDISSIRGHEESFYVKGELESLYKGATLNEESFIQGRKDKINKFNGFYLTGYRSFKKTGFKARKIDTKDLTEDERRKIRQKGQESPEVEIKDDSQDLFSFSWKDGYWVYHDENDRLFIRFKNIQGKMVPFEIVTSFKKTNIVDSFEPIHYSVSEREDKFSFLGYVGDGEFRSLLAITFTKKVDEKLIEKGDPSLPFYYPLGPGKRAILERGSTISLCGSKYEWMTKEIERAFKTWNKFMPKDYIFFNILNEYPPFSDVNVKCIYMIDDYAFSDPEGDSVSSGFVMPHYNISKRELIDADMILGLNEWKTLFRVRGYGSLNSLNKDKESEAREEFYHTALHEMGHLLGLGHAFTKRRDHDSIMSYRKHKKFTPYDKQSIQELYAPFF